VSKSIHRVSITVSKIPVEFFGRNYQADSKLIRKSKTKQTKTLEFQNNYLGGGKKAKLENKFI
jgi:hypothetical protein